MREILIFSAIQTLYVKRISDHDVLEKNAKFRTILEGNINPEKPTPSSTRVPLNFKNKENPAESYKKLQNNKVQFSLRYQYL